MLRELEHVAERPQVVRHNATTVRRAQQKVSQEQGGLAVEGFAGLTFTRFPADWLRPRMWALRHNLSGYDATHVALAEMTDATALLTTDARLAQAPAPRCHIQLL